MYNLVTNAVQAMPKGGKLTIHAYKDKKTNEAVITVTDTGVGIPESVKNKLFTPMFTTKSKGQGFGLAVIKRMAEALNGNVIFESQEGKGTKFTVRLPQNIKRKRAFNGNLEDNFSFLLKLLLNNIFTCFLKIANNLHHTLRRIVWSKRNIFKQNPRRPASNQRSNVLFAETFLCYFDNFSSNAGF